MSRDTPVPDETDLPTREENRLAALASYDLAESALAAAVGAELTEHANFAAQLTGAQFAAVNIIGDTYQQSIAGSDGLPLATISRDDSVCGRILHATGPGDVYITSDANKDSALASSPWVASGDVRFYAGAALIGSEGLPLGMLCVFSSEPISDESAERAANRLLPVRDSVMAVLQAHRKAGRDRADESVGNTNLAPERIEISGDASIDDVIDNGDVHTLFQPIVHLETGTVAAFEALTRGPTGTKLESPLALLDAARAVGRLGELDRLCRASALRVAARSGLPDELSWFVNLEPGGLEADCPPHLSQVVQEARTGLRVVLEIVDRGVEARISQLLRTSNEARQDAWGIAVNDVGGGPGSLALLPLLQPDIVRLDMSVLHEGPSPATADVAAAIRAYAERTGAVIVAEGIETREHQELARVFGASYGQGYLYGGPAALPTSLPAPAQPFPLRQKLAPATDVTPFEALQKSIASETGRTEHLLHIATRLQRYGEASQEPVIMLALFDSAEQFHFNQDRFETAAEVNALTVCLAPGLAAQQIQSRYQVGPPPWASRSRRESALIVITPHYAGALVVRHSGDVAKPTTREVDYIYTHNESAVVAAAHALLGSAATN